MNVMKKALADKHKSALKLEIIIHGGSGDSKEKEAEKTSDLAPEIKDDDEQEKQMLASQNQPMAPAQDAEEQDDEMMLLNKMVGKEDLEKAAPDKKLGLEEMAMENMKEMMRKKKVKA